jgi:hypothetical protein
MPRFYFHYWTGERYEVDEIGLEFEDVGRAYLDAYDAAKSMSIETERAGADPSDMRFDIVDRRGKFVLQIPFTEVLGVAARPGRAERRPRSQLRAEVRDLMTRARQTLAASRDLVARSRAQA